MNIARDSVSFGPLVWRQRVGINGLTSMAIYHFHVKIVHRAKGQSTVAAAAYGSIRNFVCEAANSSFENPSVVFFAITAPRPLGQCMTHRTKIQTLPVSVSI